VAAVGKMQVLFAGRSICRAPQQAQAQDRSGLAADLGSAESRHEIAGKQQSLQSQDITGMEVGTTAYLPVIFSLPSGRG